MTTRDDGAGMGVAAAVVGPASAGLGVVALGLALRGDAPRLLQECGDWKWAILGAAVLGAVAIGVFGRAAARGSQLPVALALGAAAIPWAVGIAAMRWQQGDLFRQDHARFDESFELVLISESASCRVLGAALSAALAVGLATALLLAARGRWNADRGARAVLVSAGLALTLAWSATIAAVEAHAAIRAPFAVFGSVRHYANAAALERGAAAFTQSWWLSTLGGAACVVVIAILVGWSARRRPPGGRAIAAAAAAVLVTTGAMAFDRAATAYLIRDCQRLWALPWDHDGRFVACVLAPTGERPQPPHAVVTRDAIFSSTGRRVALSALRTRVGAEALRDVFRVALGPHRRPGMQLALAIDQRVSGRVIREIAAAASEAGASELILSGRASTPEEAAALARDAPLLAAFVGRPSGTRVSVSTQPVYSDIDVQDMDVVLGREPLLHVVPVGAGTALEVDLRQPIGRWDEQGLQRNVHVYVSDAAEARTLLAASERLERLTADVWLERAPAPSRPDVLMGTMIGDVYGTAAVDIVGIPRIAGDRGPSIHLERPVVRGSFSIETVERVIRDLRSELTLCAENGPASGARIRVVLRIIISPGGGVVRAEPVGSTLLDEPTVRCLESVLEGATFHPPTGGGLVVVDQPLTISR